MLSINEFEKFKIDASTPVTGGRIRYILGFSDGTTGYVHDDGSQELCDDDDESDSSTYYPL